MAQIRLPASDGIATYRCREPIDFKAPGLAFNRIAFAAAHVVADPLSNANPWTEAAMDWDSTLAYRHHLWKHGFAVAEAMDTAQRGKGLGWPDALTLIQRSVAEARTVDGATVFSAVGTNHLALDEAIDLDTISSAYLEQLHAVQVAGGRVILMASRALARRAVNADDYARLYADVLAEADKPVIIHWLGDMFDPALLGYWGSQDIPAAMDTCL